MTIPAETTACLPGIGMALEAEIVFILVPLPLTIEPADIFTVNAMTRTLDMAA